MRKLDTNDKFSFAIVFIIKYFFNLKKTLFYIFFILYL